MTDLLIIFAAEYLFVCSLLVFAYCWYVARDRRQFITFALVCGVVAFVFSLVAASLYNNPRPFMAPDAPAPLVAHAPGNGFPSDHSLLTGTLAAIVTVTNPYLGALLWLVAFAVGIGRVLAGVHHYIDIIASFAIAAVSVIVVRKATKGYEK